jgi:hypothetical protein
LRPNRYLRRTGYEGDRANAGTAWVFDIQERLKELSAKGDELARLNAVVDFELFRAALARAAPRSDRAKGARPPFVGRAHRISDQGSAIGT